MDEKGYIKGKLNYMIFHNAEEQFSIASISILETNELVSEDEIVVKGHFPQLTYGNEYIFYGTIIEHPKFGEQYDVFTYEKELPKTEDSLIKYLSSDLFFGIGKKTAERIVQLLGIKAVDKILENEDVLDQIPSINKKLKARFLQDLRLHQGFERVTMELAKYGIGLQIAQKIYDVYQENTIQQLHENPYDFVFKIEGFGFQRADEMAIAIGLDKDHPSRIQAGFLHILELDTLNGHVYTNEEDLIVKTEKLLFPKKDAALADEDWRKFLTLLEEEEMIVKENDRIYLPHLYYAEEGIGSQLKRIIDMKEEEFIDESELLKTIGMIEEEEGFSYGEEQYDAIKLSLKEKVMILTGGPGTGKTTVIKGIIQCYDKLLKNEKFSSAESNYILAAPTGRAAKRLSETTGLTAKTIHSLLGWMGEDQFEYNSQNKLKGKMLIVDEFSMVDVWLANRLLKAVPSEMKVIFVGDEDQLPSVGPGQVLSDILESNKLPISRLTDIYRQKEDSFIIQLAHKIKNDDVNNLPLTKKGDFNFIPCQQEQILATVEKIVTKAVDKGYQKKDIQVLAPMYKTNVGIHQLNRKLQQIFNPTNQSKRRIQHFDDVLITGDKVIQLVNQPEKQVYNGDIGEIVAIKKANESESKKEEVIVDYDGLLVPYTKQELNQIMLAYAISIHKSQGSEFPIVILPVARSYRRMLVKKLLYTAITRSKSSLIICGEYDAFIDGLNKDDAYVRKTTLVDRIEHIFNLDRKLDEDDEQVEDEELSPYDFM